VANLSAVVTYTGAYVAGMTGDFGTVYPTVTFHTNLLVTAASTFDTEFIGSTAAAMTGDNSSTLPILQQFRTLEFVFATPAFTSYPLEAIIGVSYAAPSTDTLETVVGAAPAATDAQNSPPVNLFEQLLANDKIGIEGLSDQNGSGSALFTEGDSISLYVAYHLTKTREFVIDSTGLTGAVTTIYVGGVTVGGGGPTVNEVSDVVVKNVRWKFVQSA